MEKYYNEKEKLLKGREKEMEKYYNEKEKLLKEREKKNGKILKWEGKRKRKIFVRISQKLYSKQKFNQKDNIWM